jgi:SAM dependent carboxyl methyltransferase
MQDEQETLKRDRRPAGVAPARAVTTGMVGRGFYNRHSAPQMAAIAHVLPWLDSAIADLPLTGTISSLGLADFGCSEGGNSIAVMVRLVAGLRTRTSKPIQTICSDLPTNDYSELFRLLRPDGRSVFDFAEIYSAVVGGGAATAAATVAINSAGGRITSTASLICDAPRLALEPNTLIASCQSNGALCKRRRQKPPLRAIPPRPRRQSAASTADMQLLELFLQQGDRVLRVLQVRDKVGRGATDITRDVRIFHNRFVEIDNDGVNQG